MTGVQTVAAAVAGRAGAVGPARSRRWRFRDPVAGIPVAGFVGANGAGKTLLAVSSAVSDLRAGRRVVSTVAIDSPWGRSEPLDSLRHLLGLRGCTVLLDEVASIFSSRLTSSLPAEVVVLLQTLRHHEVTVRWTAPAWARADILLRECTQAAVSVRPLIRRAGDGYWPRPVVIGAGVLDTTSVPTDAQPDRILARRVFLPKRLPGWGMYDTLADPVRIGWNVQTGVCVDCGGTVRKESCTPERHERLGVAV